MFDCGKLCTAKMDIFPQIMFNLNYELRGGGREGERPGYISANQVCWYNISRPRQIREEQKWSQHCKADSGLEAREIMAVSVHKWDDFDSLILCRSPNIKYISKQKLILQVWKLAKKSYWRPSWESRKRWSNVLSDRAVNSSEIHIMPPKRLSLDSYFSGCAINGKHSDKCKRHK